MSSSGRDVKKEKNKKNQTEEQCGLLDLPDPVLVLILERVNNVAQLVRFSSLNRRLSTLPYQVTRINTVVRRAFDELILLRFLESLTLRGGCLRDLEVYFHTRKRSLDATNSLWITPVSGTLERLELHLEHEPVEEVRYLKWQEQDPFSRLVARCTTLVRLEVRGTGAENIDPRVLETVVASCPALESLIVFYDCFIGEGFELELTSLSLRKIELHHGASVTLTTPSLTDLMVSLHYVDVRSHSLRRLSLETDLNHIELEMEEDFFAVEVSPKMAYLDYLCIGECFSPRQMQKLLGTFPGVCVDVLQLELEAGSWGPMTLAALLEPVSKLRSLMVSFNFLEDILSSEPGQGDPEVEVPGSSDLEIHGDSQALKRLGVEELVLVTGNSSRLMTPHHLRRILSNSNSSLLQKVVIDWGFHSAGPHPVVESLKVDFPGLVTERKGRRGNYNYNGFGFPLEWRRLD